MCIVTGPNIDIAIKLIKRMKGLFEQKLGLTFANKKTVLELNGCRIEAYPSNHIDAYCVLDNPKFILLDEADFFRKGHNNNVVLHMYHTFSKISLYTYVTSISTRYAIIVCNRDYAISRHVLSYQTS
jgi:hypothetical protein